MTEDICNCDEFKKALEPGTDGEGWYPAICPNLDDKTKYQVGDFIINFCPWCGKKVPDREENNE